MMEKQGAKSCVSLLLVIIAAESTRKQCPHSAWRIAIPQQLLMRTVNQKAFRALDDEDEISVLRKTP